MYTGIKAGETFQMTQPIDGSAKFVTAGWLAITAVLLGIITMILGIIWNMNEGLGLIPLQVITLVEITLSAYAFYMFKVFLNERYNFHKTDSLIIATMIGGILIGLLNIATRIVLPEMPFPVHELPKEEALAFARTIIPVFMGLAGVGIPTAILSIIFANRLMTLDAPLYGLKRPIGIMTIVACAFFLTFFLAILGFILSAVVNIMMGIVLLSSTNEEEWEENPVDFV